MCRQNLSNEMGTVLSGEQKHAAVIVKENFGSWFISSANELILEKNSSLRQAV
jgi:hypothetical protein